MLVCKMNELFLYTVLFEWATGARPGSFNGKIVLSPYDIYLEFIEK